MATSTPKVVCILHNDATDSDNHAAAQAWNSMMHRMELDKTTSLIEAFYIAEPRAVNFGVRTGSSTDTPKLLSLCEVLFGSKRRQVLTLMKNDPDVISIYERWRQNPIAIFLRADKRSKNAIEKLVRMITTDQEFWKEIKTAPDLLKWVRDMGEVGVKNWAQQVLMMCVNKNGPPEDSALIIRLTLLDYIETMRLHMRGCSRRIRFLVDDDSLSNGDLATPLNHRIGHPEYIVGRGQTFIDSYIEIMQDGNKNEKARAEDVRKLLVMELTDKEESLKVKCIGDFWNQGPKKTLGKDIQLIESLGPDLSKLENSLQAASVVYYFGGASMTILAKLMDRGYGPKMRAYCQGGTMDVSLNLTGNPFNFDLNPRAVQRVLNIQLGVDKSKTKLQKLQLITTEAGKAIFCTVNGLATLSKAKPEGPQKTGVPSLKSWQLGLRAAAYGIDNFRNTPERLIKKYYGLEQTTRKSEFFRIYGGTAIRAPDMVAFLAAFSPAFSEHHRDKVAIHPKQISIRGTAEKVVFWNKYHPSDDGFEAAFTGPQRNREVPEGAIELWMPKWEVTKPHTLEDITGYIKDCRLC